MISYRPSFLLFLIYLNAQLQASAIAAPHLELLHKVESRPGHHRNSEADLEILRDGSLCLIYSQFPDSDADHAHADLVQTVSTDQGKTWPKPKVIVRSEGGQNVMSVTLLRLENGSLALFYLQKVSNYDCRPVMRVSLDEAKTWSKPTTCITDEIGYYVLNNDRVRQLKGGRLVLPVAQHKIDVDHPPYAGTLMCYLSDDNGATWHRSQTTLQGHKLNQRFCVQEPGVLELTDGRLWMYCRTDQGFQFSSYSSDQGETWTPLVASPLASPRSPATMARIPWSGQIICLWNDHSGAHPFEHEHRTPWCIAISQDDGKTFGKSFALERDPSRGYCYSSATFERDRLLVTYSAGPGDTNPLGELRVAAISRDWLDKFASATTETSSNSERPHKVSLSDGHCDCLDYGRSFVQAQAGWNAPRFWIESRLTLHDPQASEDDEFLQCGACKSENTFADKDLFTDNNYDFLPVFGKRATVVFRKQALFHEGYRETRPTSQWWDGNERRLRIAQGRILNTPQQIESALMEGLPFVGQTELRDEATGRTAVIEYPIKTFNWSAEKRQWQVDTGPILLPDLSVPHEKWAESFELAYIAFNNEHEADFVIRGRTPVSVGEKQVVNVHHYSQKRHLSTRNRLITWGDSEN